MRGTTPENEPGNQLAGLDARWTSLWFGTPVSLYGQMIGEDEAGGFPSRYLGQFGIEGSGITRDQYSYPLVCRSRLARVATSLRAQFAIQLRVSSRHLSIWLHLPRAHHRAWTG